MSYNKILSLQVSGEKWITKLALQFRNSNSNVCPLHCAAFIHSCVWLIVLAKIDCFLMVQTDTHTEIEREKDARETIADNF